MSYQIVYVLKVKTLVVELALTLFLGIACPATLSGMSGIAIDKGRSCLLRTSNALDGSIMPSAIEMQNQHPATTKTENDNKRLADCDHVENGVTSPCSKPDYVDDNTRMSMQAEELQYTDQEDREGKRKIDFTVLLLLCGCHVFSLSLRNENFHAKNEC